MEDNKKKEADNWIRLASKSHPGRFYMFNKATGETQWLQNNEGPEAEKKTIPSPQISFSRASKTPAQDRLKRLQHSLNATQNRNHNSKSSRQSSNSKLDSKKEQENHLNEPPSTSYSNRSQTISPRKAIKRSQSISLHTEDETKTFKTSAKDTIKKPRLLESPSNSTKSTTHIKTIPSNNSKLPTANNTTEEFQIVDSGNTTTLSNFRTGIFKKIKEICKIPFSATKKLAQKKFKAKDEESNNISLANNNSFKAAKRIQESQQRLSYSLQESIIRDLRSDSNKSPDLYPSAVPTSLSTSKSLNIPKYPKGSANSRLERLKQSLLSQQQQQQQTLQTDANANSTNTSQIPGSVPDSIKNYDNLNTSENNIIIDHDDNSINSSHHTANNANNNEIEAMDWQPIVRDEETLNKSTNYIDSGFTIEKSKKCSFLVKDANDNQAMGDIYDTVNENLLRYSAEKQKDSTNDKDKWRKDFYYFIVDTNVLIRNLTFVEELTKMILCDTKGSMLYIPYTVLQELDKLKMCSGMKEGVKTLAVRAIKYLNEKFENNSFQVKAQSALDEKNHLIDVNSPDDSILNCCLQVKKHVKNILLLTEDINLRNKAICNNILVSTKSDLVSKRYDFNNSNKTL